ncbi:hypothetical protein BC628DRAFT_1330340 [Trametes gibbosa]|nr:hypothetical protein BC628DRAFT_1330340 [Trametes gibbosa]
MGRSAKFHKRQSKKTTSGSGPSSSAHTPAPKPTKAATPAEQKKRAGLKEKAGKHRRSGDDAGPVLGGADYVELMLGGRRRARAEAAKLPREVDPEDA